MLRFVLLLKPSVIQIYQNTQINLQTSQAAMPLNKKEIKNYFLKYKSTPPTAPATILYKNPPISPLMKPNTP